MVGAFGFTNRPSDLPGHLVLGLLQEVASNLRGASLTIHGARQSHVATALQATEAFEVPTRSPYEDGPFGSHPRDVEMLLAVLRPWLVRRLLRGAPPFSFLEYLFAVAL